MKELADGTLVLSRMYYYLLDFNDRTDLEYISHNFNKHSLNSLNKTEFLELFAHATAIDSAV